MTIAEFYLRDGEPVGFKVRGHSGHGDAGEDVVCASVSSAVMLTANLITDSFGIDAKVSVGKDGLLELKADDTRSSDLKRLCAGLRTHLQIIAEEYGEKYLKIELTEV